MSSTPSNLLAEIAELKRRLAALETAPRLPQSSIQDGRIAILEADGDERAVFGRFRTADGVTGDFTGPFAEPPLYGFTVLDADGNTVVYYMGTDAFYVSDVNGTPLIYAKSAEAGFAAPEFHTGWQGLTYTSTTSASFTTIFQSGVGGLFHDAVLARVAAYCDADTTGEIRVSVLGGASSAAKALTTSATVYSLAWQHQDNLGAGGTATFLIEARRTGGAGKVYVRPDSQLIHRNSDYGSASTAGVWTP